MQPSDSQQDAVVAMAVRPEAAGGVVFAKRATTPGSSAGGHAPCNSLLYGSVPWPPSRQERRWRWAWFSRNAQRRSVERPEGVPSGQVREGARDATVWHSAGLGHDRVRSLGRHTLTRVAARPDLPHAGEVSMAAQRGWRWLRA
jgi:hypothetical protein